MGGGVEVRERAGSVEMFWGIKPRKYVQKGFEENAGEDDFGDQVQTVYQSLEPSGVILCVTSIGWKLTNVCTRRLIVKTLPSHSACLRCRRQLSLTGLLL